MSFPINLNIDLTSINSQKTSNYDLDINSGITVLVGPNGSGKTQILRAIKTPLYNKIKKKVRFLSAGRIGFLEQYRSNYSGYPENNNPPYDQATFGSKRDSVRRHYYETIKGDYHTLSVRTDILIKVQERLRKLFNRNIFLEWDGGDLKVLFSRNDISSSSYSSARETSGLLHLVAILSALYDDEIGALFLDEPEISLHPQLQAFLLREIRR